MFKVAKLAWSKTFWICWTEKKIWENSRLVNLITNLITKTHIGTWWDYRRVKIRVMYKRCKFTKHPKRIHLFKREYLTIENTIRRIARTNKLTEETNCNQDTNFGREYSWSSNSICPVPKIIKWKG